MRVTGRMIIHPASALSYSLTYLPHLQREGEPRSSCF